MDFSITEANGIKIATAKNTNTFINTAQDAIDLIATLRYEYDCERVIIPKECFAKDFFDLTTGFAGEVLQKYINYQMKLAIIGDFSAYTSKALKDFMHESNNGNAIFFLENAGQAFGTLQQN